MGTFEQMQHQFTAPTSGRQERARPTAFTGKVAWVTWIPRTGKGELLALPSKNVIGFNASRIDVFGGRFDIRQINGDITIGPPKGASLSVKMTPGELSILG